MPGPARPWLAAALFAAFLLHNGEEALAYPWTRDAAAALLGADLPSAVTARRVLAAVTLAGGAALLWAGSGPDSPGRVRVLRGFAALLVLNVFVPHVPAAVAFGGYAPGLATALLVNLPLGVFVWRKLGSSARSVPH